MDLGKVIHVRDAASPRITGPLRGKPWARMLAAAWAIWGRLGFCTRGRETSSALRLAVGSP